MTDPTAARRDWFYWFIVLFILTEVPTAAQLLLDFVLHPLAPEYVYHSTAIRLIVVLVILPMVIIVALLVNRRARGNLTGLFLLLWVSIMLGQTARAENQALKNMSVAWVGIWFLPLFFPDGHAYPRRFERPIRLLCVGLVLSVFIWGFTVPYESDGLLPNPLYIPALGGLQDFASVLEPILLIATLATVIVSLVARYRCSSQLVRQQMKWLGWTIFAIILSVIPTVLSGTISRDPQTFTPTERLINFVWSLFITLAPFAAVSIAILRYKLYDIDIIIRRTLIYSILTAVLAAIYFGGVVLAQQVFRAATGEGSDLAIVASTLLIAALFTPLRRRIQQTIDRRFYRRKYDAEQTLARFNQTLRDEVDVETLQEQLIGVVQETMQPTKVALWIMSPKESQP